MVKITIYDVTSNYVTTKLKLNHNQNFKEVIKSQP